MFEWVVFVTMPSSRSPWKISCGYRANKSSASLTMVSTLASADEWRQFNQGGIHQDSTFYAILGPDEMVK